MKLVDTPRSPVMLVDRTEGSPLGDHPAKGQWVMGIRVPLLIWWRCPKCRGQVPIEFDEVNEDGVVSDPMAHSEANSSRSPLCEWSDGLRLLDYDREEHERARAEARRRYLEQYGEAFDAD